MSSQEAVITRIGEHAEVSFMRGTATIRLVGAKSANVLNSAAITNLTQAVHEAASRPAVRVIVLRGSGDRAFIGGADIFEMSRLDRITAEQFIRSLKNLGDALSAAPQPVIARLSGWCLGAGLEMAVACDIRVAGRSGCFGMPEVSVGIPSVIQAALLPRLIGESRSAYLLISCESIDSETALNWGLVHEVVDDHELDARINTLAARLIEFGPAALAQQKRLLRRWRTLMPDDAVEESIREFGSAFDTGEPQRHMGAFIEDRRRNRDGP